MTRWNTTNGIQVMAECARRIAFRTADGGYAKIQHYLHDSILDDGELDGSRVSQDSMHHGDPAKVVDALADEGCRIAHRDAAAHYQDLLGVRVARHVYVSEESGAPTMLVAPKTLVARVDPADGTTRALQTMMGFGTAVAVDRIREPGRPATHLGGAIVTGIVDIAWSHTSPRSPRTGERAHLEGQVFLRFPLLSRDWDRLPLAREDRAASLAGVAASAERFRAILSDIQQTHDNKGRFYGEAGNPILPALLIGQLREVIEPEDVTLHDSMFLIPFTLMGGHVYTWDGQEMDYLAVYEANATNLDPKLTPIPPYRASFGRTS